jgi:hypothetical protein
MNATTKSLYIVNVVGTAEHYIAKNVNIIIVINSSIPSFNDGFIHLLDGIKSSGLPDEFSIMPQVQI